MIVKQQVSKVFGEDKLLLKFAFESIIKSLLNNQYRLQSFIEYSMSIASTSNSSCNANHIENHERHQNIHLLGYLSPSCDFDHIQVEYIKNIILNESENLYNQKIEEIKNQTVCEAAIYRDSKLTDKKQSIKALPLLGFAES